MPRKTIVKKTIKKEEKRKKITRRVSVSRKSRKEEPLPKIKGILSSMEEEISKVIHAKTSKEVVKGPEIGKMIIREDKIPEVSKYSDLPEGYNDTKIIVLVRDPYWIYTYWEIAKEKIEELKRILGIVWNYSKTILRVYDVTDIIFDGTNAHKSFDITLPGMVNSWYINIGYPDRSYCVEIGILVPDNKFYLLARSNVVITPRDTISPVLDEEWLISEEEVAKLYASGRINVGGSEEVGAWIRRGLKEQVSSRS